MSSLDAVRRQIAVLREEILELESHLSDWDSGSTSGGRELRSIAGRIILSSKRLEALVKENTYAP
ncbi:MAG: hypothetical protein H8E10_15030 [Desulfobacterales bacterium]|nr:hypothetical protein [Desulfobacterales bacterium]MBL7101837.1 hypothetical protein [Desulfobacteraceae bacterium]MBL7172386.1 hypothetical protein [Desulfobacteraceae bacterium]